jgi:hypothetical protein
MIFKITFQSRVQWYMPAVTTAQDTEAEKII